MENISFNVFWIFKLDDIKKWQKYKIRNIWSFYRNILQKIARKNSSQMIPHFKRYVLVRSNVPCFFTKRESVTILKMTNFWRENMTFFHDVKKQTNKKPRLFLIFVNKEIFSQIYGEMEIKIFFITSEGIFEWQK